MIIYNVTIAIMEEKEQDFISWMKNEHISEVLETGCFIRAVFTKLLTQTELEGGNTYAVQYYTKDQQTLQLYYTKYAPALRLKGQEKFGESMMGFRTELEFIEEFYPTSELN